MQHCSIRLQFLAIRVDENVAILAQARCQFLAITVDGQAAILAQPDTFDKKYFESLYSVMYWEI